jgi:hypothetical protein
VKLVHLQKGKRWKEFLKEILKTSTSLTGREEPVRLPPELPVSIRLPLKREIVDAIKAIKNEKAAGQLISQQKY